MNSVPSVRDRAAAFEPISLQEMDSVKLQNRIDTKYLTSEATLMQVLEDAREAGYRALETEGAKISPYYSVYYDTPGLKMFLDHHNRRLVRQKVRTRVYVEIKRKNNHGRTKKKRTRIDKGELMDFSGDEAAKDYLARKSDYTADMISPSSTASIRSPSATRR